MALVSGVIAAVGACTQLRETQPDRTATEQLLISTAADNAVAHLDPPLSPDTAIWLDTSHFEAYDRQYAIAAIRSRLLKIGARMAPNRADAEVIVEARAGALSVNQRNELFGSRAFDIPVPLAGPIEIPKISIVERNTQVGVAKFTLTGIDAETGAYLFEAGPVMGLAWRHDWSVIGIGWTSGDVQGPD